jgi:hypothetical protein
MKYLLILWLILVITLEVVAQNKIAVGVNLTPTLNLPVNSGNLPKPKTQFGYNIGIDGFYYLNEIIYLETEINFSFKKLLIAKDLLTTRYTLIDINSNGILDPEDRIDYSRICNEDIYRNYYLLKLPIYFNYKNNFVGCSSFLVSVGFELNYLFQKEDVSDSKYGKEIISTEKVSGLISSLYFGVGYCQPILSDFILIVTPNYSFDFYSSGKIDYIRFHTFGISAKFIYSFN